MNCTLKVERIMETKLARIAEAVRNRPKERLTSLVHLVNVETLEQCHHEMVHGKASGIDWVTKQAYEENPQANLANLMARMKRNAYKPLPVRRTYIEKPGSQKLRPLGIPAYEDKLVQRALAKILNTIYEPEFLDCSFGFRPNRGCHDALKILNHYVERRQTNNIVDADIKGFFDHVDHEWLMKFLELRIADPNFLRLIRKFLKSGVIEAGIKYDTPEGGVVSPILANIYLHYVLDLWFEKVVRKACKGQVYMVLYADDFVCCFQYQKEAEVFYPALKERLARFNLELAEDKTRIIPFGRHAGRQSQNKKPDTFDFLGFTHYCSKGKKGQFRVKRKTSKKKYRASLVRANRWLKDNRHMPVDILMKKLRRKLLGYYQYYAITDNYTHADKFQDELKRRLF